MPTETRGKKKAPKYSILLHIPGYCLPHLTEHQVQDFLFVCFCVGSTPSHSGNASLLLPSLLPPSVYFIFTFKLSQTVTVQILLAFCTTFCRECTALALWGVCSWRSTGCPGTLCSSGQFSHGIWSSRSLNKPRFSLLKYIALILLLCYCSLPSGSFSPPPPILQHPPQPSLPLAYTTLDSFGTVSLPVHIILLVCWSRKPRNCLLHS